MSFDSSIEKPPKGPETVGDDLALGPPAELTSRLTGEILLGGAETAVQYPDKVFITQEDRDEFAAEAAALEKGIAALEKKTITDPNLPLTKTELWFLYELDDKFDGEEYEPPKIVSDLREKRRETDKPELRRILSEAIREQVQGAFMAYQMIAEQLNNAPSILRREDNTLSSDEFQNLFDEKDTQWLANGIYEYLVDKLLDNGEKFALVATPNIEADEEQIVSLALRFGKYHPSPINIDQSLFLNGLYDNRELSGVNGAEPVRLSLISNKVIGNELGCKPVDEQLRLLRKLQVSQPNLHVRVPSVLDAITHWYTLHAQGVKLDKDNVFDKTFIRHIDVEPKRSTWWPEWNVVPETFLNQPRLKPPHNSSGLRAEEIRSSTSTRLAVG